MLINVNSNYNSICKLFNFSKKKFPKFKKLRETVRKLKFQNMRQYDSYVKKHNKQWPTNPNKYYVNDGWIDVYDFLGIKSWKEQRLEFPKFEDLRRQVRSCKFNTVKEYQKNRKENWPSNPQEIYFNDFVGFYDLLGTRPKEFPSFDNLKAQIKNHKFKTIKNYREYAKDKKKIWPFHPKKIYASNWKGVDDFLGKS
jgi:hypothetical protein